MLCNLYEDYSKPLNHCIAIISFLTACCVWIFSGGTGTMFSVQIEAEEFRGKRLVLQHRMVNEVCLPDEISCIKMP